MIKQQKIADYILHILKHIDPNAFVAGGAVVNRMLGNPAKDLDIYVKASDWGMDTSDVEKTLRKAGLVLTKKLQAKDFDRELYSMMACLIEILDFDYEDEKIQIMIVNTNRDGVMDQFACNMSKAYYTPEDGFVYTKEFRLGVKTQSIILGRNVLESYEYINKVKAKFPTYKVRTEKQAMDILLDISLA